MDDFEFAWTQKNWEELEEARHRRVTVRNRRLASLGLVGLAILIFELTANPAISVIPGCLKFGWDAFVLARWLKRTDPDQVRGRICSRFYLAWGFWKISLRTLPLILVMTIAQEVITGQRLGVLGPPTEVISALLLVLASFLISSIVSCFAVISAYRYQVKVWVGPEARWTKEAGTWPPRTYYFRKAGKNHTKSILISALLTGFVIILACFLAVLLPGPGNNFPEEVFFTILPIFTAAVAISILLFLQKLGRRMIAASPEECWA